MMGNPNAYIQSGGSYDSPFFAVFLFTMAEILRREESSRRRAMRASRQIAELNSIFSQLGQAHLDIRKVFDTVLHAATTLDDVLFGAILEKRRPDTQWMVSATSNPDYCQLAAQISVPPNLETEPFSSMLTDDGSEAIFPCLRNARRMIVGNLQEFSSSESGMLVVANLLTNAGKFAEPPSGIVVRFRADGERATLSVCNRGKPVSEDELDTIFEKYYTGRDAGALAGTGLGLYIARQLVTLHGGELWAENGEDGTCFQFTLQLARDEESDE